VNIVVHNQHVHPAIAVTILIVMQVVSSVGKFQNPMISVLVVASKIKNSDEGLLTFDEDSPLFVKRKKKPSINKQKTKKSAPKTNRKSNINSPADCKHIRVSFKKKIEEKWELLDTGTAMQAADIAGYIRGVAAVIKTKRPKEYEELMELVFVARTRANKERNKR